VNRVILAYSQLRGDLPAAQRERLRAQLPYARRLRMPLDAGRQSLTYLGLALACRLLSDASGRQVEPAELRFTRTGKPYAPGCPHFSITHAGQWVLCALAAQGEVGIDAEEGGAARSRGYTLATWAAKEATVKAAGATLAELGQVQLRGRRICFRGRSWYCRTPRLNSPLIVRVVTARRVTQLLLRSMPVESALAA
jgi:phosphopantetheinyl transferase